MPSNKNTVIRSWVFENIKKELEVLLIGHVKGGNLPKSAVARRVFVMRPSRVEGPVFAPAELRRVLHFPSLLKQRENGKCPGRDLNPHVLLGQQILSLQCLPIPPPGRAKPRKKWELSPLEQGQFSNFLIYFLHDF